MARLVSPKAALNVLIKIKGAAPRGGMSRQLSCRTRVSQAPQHGLPTKVAERIAIMRGPAASVAGCSAANRGVIGSEK